MKAFRLELLKITHHQKVIFNVQFLDQDLQNSNKAFTTLILGPNGAGKSYLLTIVANIFIFLEKAKNFKRKPKFRYDQFSIVYSINGHQYRVERFSGRNIMCYCDSNPITLEMLDIPQRILAVSFLVNDKFLFSTPENESKLQAYKYLGVRKTSNATYTSSVVQNVIQNIYQISLSEHNTELQEILSMMHFDSKIQFDVCRKSSSKSSKRLNLALNESPISSGPFIINLSDHDDALLGFLKANKGIIAEAMSKELLELSNIGFFKNNELIHFEDCSSGEKHLLFSLSGILRHIKPNSIILIDEPEISLHPEWQTKYIGLIKKIFKDYSSCHFLIASHSHYLVSDLEPSTSSIVFMRRFMDEQSLSSELLAYSTYAWSAENVIYNIFGVRTTRNYYFEADLRKIVNLMNTDDESGANVEKIQELLLKLKKVVFDESDPLNIVLNQAQEFCNVHKKNA